MTHYVILMIIGWCFLISSWVLPYLTKDDLRRRFIGVAFSALAVGVFIGAFVVGLC